jgi:hypothetical protein
VKAESAPRGARSSAASAILSSRSASKRDRSDSQFEQAQLLANFSKNDANAAAQAEGGTESAAGGVKAERPPCLTPVLTDLASADLVKNVSMDPLTDSSACSSNNNNAAAAEAALMAAVGGVMSGFPTAAAALDASADPFQTSLPFKKRRKTAADNSSSAHNSTQDLAGSAAAAEQSAMAVDDVNSSNNHTVDGSGGVQKDMRDTDTEGRDSLCSSRNSDRAAEQQQPQQL